MKPVQWFSFLFFLGLHVRGQGYTQAPGHVGGFESDEKLAVADDFVFQSDTKISTVIWWGSHASGRASESFKIRLFANGETIAGEFVANFPTVLLMETSDRGIIMDGTGRLVTAGSKANGAEEEYQYAMSLPRSFIAQAGVRYWISVVSENGTNWIWEASASEENSGIVQNAMPGKIQGEVLWLSEAGNTAFKLR
jgi:hypothetical protein